MMEAQLPTDLQRCIICGLKSHIPYVKTPEVRSFRNIIDTAKSRKSSGTFGKYFKYINCLAISEVSVLKNRIFHKSCYNVFCFHDKPTIINVNNPDVETTNSFDCPTVENSPLNKDEARLSVITFIQDHLNENKFLSMNKVALKYVELLRAPDSDLRQIKPELKKIILTEMKNVIFLRPNIRESEIIVTISIIEDIFRKHFATDTEQLNENAAHRLRQTLLSQSPWTFTGDFKSYIENTAVLKFFQQIIGGKTESLWNDGINKDARILSQLSYQMCRTDRQVRYNSENQKTHHETPLSVGIALSSHSYNRSKHSVNELNQCQFGLSYYKVMNLENDIALSVEKLIDLSGGYAIPSWVQKNEPLFFACDNVDFNEDTFNGKNTLHGTLLVLFQRKNGSVKKPLLIDRNKTSKLTLELDCNLLECEIPQPSKMVLKYDATRLEFNKSEAATKHNLLWMSSFMNTEIDNIFPITWSAFNSCSLSKKNEISNIGMVAPILRLSPTNYSALYTSFMRAKHINDEVNPETLTVISVDLQLFDMAMKLWMSNDFIKKNFLFRPGELHVVFWALDTLGDYIEGSGIEQAWQDSGIYSAKTVRQIMTGKKMNRALEAHYITVLALSKIYVSKKIATTGCEEIKKALNRLNSQIKEMVQTHSENDFSALTDAFDKLKIFDLFGGSLNPTKMELFVLNYIKQFDTILRFIRATRVGDVELHLESLRDLLIYFFAHNHLNYARLLPLYLQIMQEIKISNPVLWQHFLKGYFVVTKSEVKFTSIGGDHGCEQEIKKLKGKGGITGITQDPASMDRYFLIAPSLTQILDDFSDMFGKHTLIHSKHHELQSSKPKRILSNMEKLREIFVEYGVGSETIDTSLHNICTKKIVDDIAASDILNRDKLGQQLVDEFIKHRLNNGEKSVWEPMKRAKIATFSCNSAKINIEKNAVGVIKEDRKLLQRFLIASRRRPELDLEAAISRYEFSVIPRSLFASDGTLLMVNTKDELKLFTELENLSKNVNSNVNDISPDISYFHISRKIWIVNGMEKLCSVLKRKTSSKCQDVLYKLINDLEIGMMRFDGLRLIFDRYSEDYFTSSIKTNTTIVHNRFIINDQTDLRNIIDTTDRSTKQQIVQYIASNVVSHCKSERNTLKEILITWDTCTNGNVCIPHNLQTHSQEEADILTILHISKLNEADRITVDSQSIVVLLLLLHFNESLPPNILFRIEIGSLYREVDIKRIGAGLGKIKADALLGWHVLTGTKRTGRFNGQTKEGTFKKFLKCPDHIVNGLKTLGNQSLDVEDVCKAVTPFVCYLYDSPYLNIEQTRWHLFLKEAPPEDMPPTEAAFKLHVSRAHYMAIIFKNALDPHFSPPDLIDFGWKKDDLWFSPIYNTFDPAPESVLKCIKCGCKTGCATLRCGCQKEGIFCTEMCTCINCKNAHDFQKIEFSCLDDSDDE